MSLYFLIPTLSLIWLWKNRLAKVCLFIGFFTLALCYGLYAKPSFPSDFQELRGMAKFVPNEIKMHRTHFHTRPMLLGTIRYFESETGLTAKNIPCRTPLPNNTYSALHKEYLLQGTLTQMDHHVRFTPDNEILWIGAEGSSSLIAKRFAIKQLLSKKIGQLYQNSTVSHFLSAITLGDLQDPLLRFSFNKLGLQHILAISGFHFGLLSLFLTSFLRLFLRKKTAYIFLLCALSAYFLLLGSSPSILRAYLAITLYLTAAIFKKNPNALNILGASLLIELVLEPANIQNLGFQLSFLATASILWLYPTTFSWTTRLLPRRTKEEISSLPGVEKIAYLILSFLRSTIALNMAVCLTVIPTCLFHFHQFPLVSLLYNLFIPLAVALSLFLLLFSLPFFLIHPKIASIITSCNELWTGKLLRTIIEAPNSLDYRLAIPQISTHILLPILLCLLLTIFYLPFIPLRAKKAYIGAPSF